jgi:hypothetical protein
LDSFAKDMKKSKSGGLTRRGFVRRVGVALAAGALPISCGRRAVRRKTLRIIQWSHYVPRYDRWFDDVFTKEWGAKNGIDVVVDHMAATEVAARGAAEAAAGKGHDLFHFLSPPAAYERQTVDHRDVVREVEKRHGKMIPLAHKSTFNPVTGKSFAFSDSYVPDPGNYRIDLWNRVGFPNGSNNRAMLSGRASFVQNAISVTRSAERENPETARRIGLTPALRGPVRRIAAEHLMSYASAATDEVFNTFVLPTMFARVARDEATPEDAVRAAQAEITRIFERRSALARDLRLRRTGERLGRLRPRSLA